MSGAQLMVHGARRWREPGWGAMSFVCMRRGRLECVPRAVVLRALRGQAGAAKDGPRLSPIRDLAITRQSTGSRPRQSEQQHHLQCNTDLNFNSILKPSVCVKCSGQAAAAPQAVQADPAHRNSHQVRGELRSKDRGSKGSGRRTLISSKKKTQASPLSELLISKETVMLMRSFIENDESNVFGVQLDHYDADDEYKRQFFYRLNPVVTLERCPQISRMLRDRASMADTVSNTSAGQTRYNMRARRKTDSTDTSALSSSTTSSDRRVRRTRRARPRGSSSDSDAWLPPKRRRTR